MSFLLDSFQNVLTGLGIAGRDKRVSAKAVHAIGVEDTILEDFHAAIPIARKIVDRIPFEGTRKWINFLNIKAELKTEFETIFRTLKTREKFKEAWVNARKVGGSLIFMAINDGLLPEEPVNEQNIESISSLVILERKNLEILTENITSDINDPNFQLPEIYRFHVIAGQQTDHINIHHTRILRFDGLRVSQLQFVNNGHWHDSVLTSMLNPIQNYSTSNDAMAAIMQDFRVNVLKMNGLGDLISASGEDKLRKRLEVLNLSRSVLGILAIDGENEEYQQNTPNLSNFDKILATVVDRLVAESEIPHTVLLGRSPTGMAGSGESERREFYDNIASKQETTLRPELEKLLRYIMLSKQGPTNGQIDPDLAFEFLPLFKLSEKEEAEVRKNISIADKNYIELNVVSEGEVASSRFGGERFSTDTKLFKAHEEMLEREQEPLDLEEEEKNGT